MSSLKDMVRHAWVYRDPKAPPSKPWMATMHNTVGGKVGQCHRTKREAEAWIKAEDKRMVESVNLSIQPISQIHYNNLVWTYC